MERKKILETPFAQWRRVILADAGSDPVAVVAVTPQDERVEQRPSWKPKSLAAAALALEGQAQAGEQLQLPGLHPFGYGYSAWAVERTPWVLGPPPPCAGIWEYRIQAIHSKQPAGEGFLWFQPMKFKGMPPDEVLDGTWHGVTAAGERADGILGWHSAFAETTEWRGLAEPCPDGYKHFVPGARRYRMPIVEG